ncbi:MAG: acyl-CoA/acyl-ACP dehydrogenase [Deltaproteobacteria bacterium]|nr:acyl-CoA/acyl-ACP dehydrogenase [Deltaproteobacteria bacterium]
MTTYFDINLDLTSEDKLIRDEAHKFAKEVMRPISREIDKMTAEEAVAKTSPVWDFVKQAYELGYHKSGFPEEVGGLGCTPLQSHLIGEEMSWGSLGLNAMLGMAAWIFGKVLMTGNLELIEEFVIPYFQCTDGSISGCWAVTEPAHGSDVLAVGEKFFKDPKIEGQVSAVLDGDEYIINGQKAAWVSCAPTASHCMLNVQIDKTLGLSGGGVCILPLNLPGVSRGKPLEKVGQRDLPQGELFFDNVRIPKRWMFHGPDTYSDSIIGNLGLGNTGVGLISLSLARAAFEEAFKYAKERVQGGKPLIEHYAMKVRIHQMFAKVEALRAMSRAVHNLNSRVDPPIFEYAAAAKTYCSETAREVIEEAVQIHGANGLTKEYFIEKIWRDSRALTIEDGDNSALNRMGGHFLKDTFPRRKVNQLF